MNTEITTFTLRGELVGHKRRATKSHSHDELMAAMGLLMLRYPIDADVTTALESPSPAAAAATASSVAQRSVGADMLTPAERPIMPATSDAVNSAQQYVSRKLRRPVHYSLGGRLRAGGTSEGQRQQQRSDKTSLLISCRNILKEFLNSQATSSTV